MGGKKKKITELIFKRNSKRISLLVKRKKYPREFKPLEGAGNRTATLVI